MPILMTYLYSDVVKNGSVSAAYPSGFTPDSFDKAGAKACIGSAEVSLPADSYSLSWGASAVTVTSLKDTWTAGVSLFVSVPDVVTGQGEEVRSIVDPVTGRISLLGPNGEVNPAMNDETPVFMVGGDHPLLGWQGSASNGMAKMYADYGIKPYIAVNSGANTYLQYPTDFMTWDQIKSISGSADIVAHGHRHVQTWTLINTGISVTYTGAAATATVAVTATQIVGATAGAVEDFTYTFATAGYTTLAELVAAIDALPNWSCTLAPELSGTEASNNLMIRAAYTAKTTALPLAAGGGMRISNNGTTYKHFEVFLDGGTFELYADGVRLYTTAVTTTFATVVAALNALGAGVLAELCNDTPQADINYMSGSETLGRAHFWAGLQGVPPEGLVISAGLSHWYMVERQMAKNIAVAAANGVTLRHFAQSGGGFYNDEAHGHPFKTYRGNPRDTTYPCAFLPGSRFIQHVGLTGKISSDAYYVAERCTAALDALADSPGFCVNFLMHQIKADGAFGGAYTFPTSHPTNFDQTETSWKAFLDLAKAHMMAGRLRNLGVNEFAMHSTVARTLPSNLLFNPKFKNSGESLVGLNNDPGAIMPGWKVQTSANVTSFAVSAEGWATLVLSATATVSPIKQVVQLPPGTYEFGFECPSMSRVGGEGVFGNIFPTVGEFWNLNGQIPGQTTFQGGHPMRSQGSYRMRFSVYPPKPAGARIISKTAQPYNLTTNKAIKLTVNGGTPIDNLDCSAGAVSSSAVTAKEIAVAINAAIVTAAWGAEYHNMASAVNGKVVLTSPYVGTSRTHIIKVETATALDACATIFGSAMNMASPRLADNEWPGYLPVSIQIAVSLNSGDSVTFGRPFLRQINDFS